jgi:hypothetical protein
MRFPAYVDLMDYIDPSGVNTYLLGVRVGQDYTCPFQFLQADGTTPEDQTGRTYKIVIGTNLNQVDQLVYTGTSSDANGVLSQPSVSAPTPTNGTVIISLSGKTTGKLPTDQTPLFYSVLNTTGGLNESMVEGQISLTLGLGA